MPVMEERGDMPMRRTLRHVVLFAYVEGAGPAERAEVTRRFSSLPAIMPFHVGFERGVNNSPEGLSHGFDQCFMLSFKDEADRDAYLPHPAHLEFGRFVKPLLRDVLVFDYWT